MRFFYVKNEQTCKGCGSTLLYGDEAVVILLKYVRDGDGTYKVPITFHVGCYLEWDSQMFMRRLERWRQESTQRPPRRRKLKPKIGRPRKYKNILGASKVSGLLRYYKRIGNEDKIQELSEKLEELKL